MQGRYRRPILLLAIAAALLATPSFADDLASARAVFEKNLQSIRDKDRDSYLACYLESEGLVRTGPGWAMPVSPRPPARAGPTTSRPRTCA